MTVLRSLPALPDHQEQQLVIRLASASTAHKTLRRELRKRGKHAMSDEMSTATPNTHTHTDSSQTLITHLLTPLTSTVVHTHLQSASQAHCQITHTNTHTASTQRRLPHKHTATCTDPEKKNTHTDPRPYYWNLGLYHSDAKDRED